MTRHAGLWALIVAAGMLTGTVATPWSPTEPATTALVGLHPLVVYVVNARHNDALVALVLFGAAGATARRPMLGALLIGIAASIKLTALLSVLGLVWWASRRQGWRRACVAAGVAAGVPITGYAMAGGRRRSRPCSPGPDARAARRCGVSCTSSATPA